MYMSSCEKKLNGYVNLKRTVGYQGTKIGEFACYILACLSSCLITEWLQFPHEATSSCHRVSVYCTVSWLCVYVYGLGVSVLRGSLSRDLCPGEVSVCWGLSPGEVSVWGSLSGGLCPGSLYPGSSPSPCGQTDGCKTLPFRNFVRGQ